MLSSYSGFSNPIENVFILVSDIVFAIVEISVESIPPDKNVPTSTSEISCELTLENNNISSSFNPGKEINFELFNDYIANNFYPVADVIYKNTKHAFDANGTPTTYYSKPSSVYLRYKQYSGYGNPKNAMTFINNVAANTIGLKRDNASKTKLAAIVSKKFLINLEMSKTLVNNIVENYAHSFEPKSTLEYAVNKIVKNPGIEIRISRSQDVQGEFKYMFIGDISLFYVSKISTFVKNIVSSFLNNVSYDSVVLDFDKNYNEEQELEIDDILDDIDVNDYLDDYDVDDYLVENVFDDNEYEDGNVPSDAVPNEPNTASVIPKATPKSIMKGKTTMTMLSRLRDVDIDLFGDTAKYGTKCQKPFQPAVTTTMDINAIRSNVSKELSSVIAALNEDPENKELQRNKNHLEYNKRAFETGVIFKDMYYSCPSIWCPTCNDFIPFYKVDNDSKKCPVCKQNIYYREDYDKETGNSSKIYYPVFRANGVGKMVPCCGVRRYNGWNKVEKGLIRDEDYSIKDGIVETKEQDENYILNKNKLFLPEGRLGHLPDTIALLFEDKNKNCLNDRNEIIRFLNDEQINCYLRMGVNADKQSFLNAVMLATPFKSTEEMLDMLFKNLTTELFITLKNGSLRYVFKDKENDRVYEFIFCTRSYIRQCNYSSR